MGSGVTEKDTEKGDSCGVSFSHRSRKGSRVPALRPVRESLTSQCGGPEASTARQTVGEGKSRIV